MNSFLIFAFLLCVASCYSAPGPQKGSGTYTDKYDDFNYGDVLKSKRLVATYVTCVIDNKGCTAEGRTLRELLPDALKTSCSKCTEKQKQGAVKIINGLEKDHPDQFKKVLDKYDPDRKLLAAFKKANPS